MAQHTSSYVSVFDVGREQKSGELNGYE